MEFLRENLQAFGQKGHLCRMDGDLSGLSGKDLAFNTHNISDIKFLKIFIVVFSNIVPCNVGLDIPFQILNVTERRFPHHTLLHDTTRYGNFPTFQLLKVVLDLLAVMCHIIFGNQKRVRPTCLKIRQFFTAHLSQLVQILILHILLLFCHCFHSFSLSDRCVLPRSAAI